MEWDQEKITGIFQELCGRYELRPVPQLFLNNSNECKTLIVNDITISPSVVLGKFKFESHCNIYGLLHEFCHCYCWIKHNKEYKRRWHNQFFYDQLYKLANENKDLIGIYNWELEYEQGKEYIYRLGGRITPPSLGTRLRSYKKL